MVTCCCSGSVNNVKYSKLGGDLARVASDSAHAVKSYDEARYILKKGLDAIIADPYTTNDERALARMGVSFGPGGVDGASGPDAALARYAVMSTIESAMPGSLGHVIAKTAVNAYQNVQSYESTQSGFYNYGGARWVLKEGFNAILSNPAETTQEERVLAKMGIDVGKGMDDFQAINARLPIMKKIAGLS